MIPCENECWSLEVETCFYSEKCFNSSSMYQSSIILVSFCFSVTQNNQWSKLLVELLILYSVVFDSAETLVHSTLEPCEDVDFTFPVNFNSEEHIVYVRCRPHLKDFLERVSGLFEIIIFTASQSIYAEQLLNVLDPKRKIFRHRVYRESCVYVEGNYLKDLTVLGRDLAHVMIIDNSPQVFIRSFV